MKQALTLSDVLARGLSLQWYEAIAIVRSVAERLLKVPGVELPIPELHLIELSSSGYVALAFGGSAAEPVRRLGQVLQALLNDAEAPVQLRLAISRATAPIPFYASIAEFDQALAYFDRPGRPGTLIALYARAAAAEPVRSADVSLTLDRIAPLPKPAGSSLLMRSRPRNARRMIAAGLGLAAVVALATAGTLHVRRAGMPIGAAEAARVTAAAADVVGSAIMAGVSAVSDRAGMGRLVGADEDSRASAQVLAASLALPLRARPVGRGSAADQLSPVMTGNEDVVGTLAAYDAALHLATASATPAHETSTSRHVGDTALSPEIFTSASEGVTPPINIRQQLPVTPPPMVDSANLSRIEIVIAPDGFVESARLLDHRSHVLGAMFLGAVKAWEFQPALKDGVAVRYRTIILVSFE
jgi:hypothetical protein